MNTQRICETIGKYGCYLLCILHHFNADDDVLDWYNTLLAEKLIDKDCYVKDPVAVARLVGGGKWDVTHAEAVYRPLASEWEVLRYERVADGTTYSHFVLPNWDPLGDSQTRLKGKLKSKRIFRRLP